MLDAMGREVTLGATYGYSNRSDGFVTVVVGKAKSFTKDRVTLDIIHRGRSLSDHPVERTKTTLWNGQLAKTTISVYSNLLFPLADDSVLWSDEK